MTTELTLQVTANQRTERKVYAAVVALNTNFKFARHSRTALIQLQTPTFGRAKELREVLFAAVEAAGARVLSSSIFEGTTAW